MLVSYFLDKYKQKHAKHRKMNNKNEPCYIRGGIDAAVQKTNNHNGRKEHGPAKNMGQKLFKPLKNAEQNRNLTNKQQQNQAKTAEYRVDNSLLPFFQKNQAFILIIHCLTPSPALLFIIINHPVTVQSSRLDNFF